MTIYPGVPAPARTHVPSVFEALARTADALNILAGLWLIVSPIVLGYALEASTNEVVCGALIVLFAAWRLTVDRAPTPVTTRDTTPYNAAGGTVNWLNLIVGVWLIASPFVLGSAHITSALWNVIGVGVAVTNLSLASNRNASERMTGPAPTS